MKWGDFIVELGVEVMEGCKFKNNTSIVSSCMIGRKCVFKAHNMMALNVHLNIGNHHYNKIAYRFDGVTKLNKLQLVNMFGIDTGSLFYLV